MPLVYPKGLHSVPYRQSHMIYVRKASVENICNWGGIKCEVEGSRSSVADRRPYRLVKSCRRFEGPLMLSSSG